MSTLDIGEVTRQSGLPPSTLRYYEERGLIAPTGRNGLRRQFDSAVVEQLALITLGQEAGFSLDEIRDMFTPDGQPNIDRTQLLNKAEEIDQTIARLSALSHNLRHTANCPAPTHLECPSFRRLLDTAGQRRNPPISAPTRPSNAHS